MTDAAKRKIAVKFDSVVVRSRARRQDLEDDDRVWICSVLRSVGAGRRRGRLAQTRCGRRHELSFDCGLLQGLSSSRPTRSMPSEETRMALE